MMDKEQLKAIESLEMSADGSLVKCQGKCGSLYPIIHKSNLTTNNRDRESDRIYELRRRIDYAKKYYPGRSSYKIQCKRDEQELKDLLEEEEKKDILHKLPGFYSSKITGYRFYCSKCWEEAYYSIYIKKKEG